MALPSAGTAAGWLPAMRRAVCGYGISAHYRKRMGPDIKVVFGRLPLAPMTAACSLPTRPG